MIVSGTAYSAVMLSIDISNESRVLVQPSLNTNGTTATPDSYLAPGHRSPLGYGYQVWLSPGDRGRYSLLGIHGQVMSVDPLSKLVIVHTAVRPEASSTPETFEFNALQAAIIAGYAVP